MICTQVAVFIAFFCFFFTSFFENPIFSTFLIILKLTFLSFLLFDNIAVLDYNNIYLGKRMYGPGRRQKVVRTMIGGMEHRFEVLDSPINRIIFTSEAFQRNLEKCRNKRKELLDFFLELHRSV